MLVSEILEIVRDIISDKQYSSNEYEDDTLIKNDLLLYYLNLSINDICKSLSLKQTHKNINYNINILSNQYLYNLNNSIYNIEDVILYDIEENKNTFLDRKYYNDEKYNIINIDNTLSKPVFYCLDYETDKILIFPKPNKDYTLKLRCNIVNNVSLNEEYPLDFDLSELSIQYILYRVFLHKDIDVRDESTSKYHYNNYSNLLLKNRARYNNNNYNDMILNSNYN